MKTWNTPWGPINLSRFPYDQDEALQAWNGADTLLIEEIARSRTEERRHVVVYNDSFGALSVALVKAGFTTTQINDSSLSQRATLWNLEANKLAGEDLYLLDSLTVPSIEEASHAEPFVLIRLPRSASLLEFQLHQMRKFLKPGTKLVAAGMTKDVHTNTIDLFERVIGPTKTSLADHKARLVFSVVEEKTVPPCPHPSKRTLAELGWETVNHASVFSKDKLDPGTRLFLKNFPKIRADLKSVVDLGCGNGILALAAAQKAPEAEVYCVDESFMAVWSARETFRANHLGGRGIFLCGDCLEDFEKDSIELILCNPPFHYQNSQTLAIAMKMFSDSYRVLKKGGELWVVANRHLGHHKSLTQFFPHVRTAGYDEQFAVFQARK